MDFIKSNILLIGLAVGSGFMLLLPLIKKNANGVPNLTSTEAVTLINRSNAVVLDVRDAAEFATGHIAEAINIPLSELNDRLTELKKYKAKPILVHCQRGARGAKACDILRAAEFKEVHHLQGGLDAWQKANLPVVVKALKTATPQAKKTAVKKVENNPVATPAVATAPVNVTASAAANDAAKEGDNA